MCRVIIVSVIIIGLDGTRRGAMEYDRRIYIIRNYDEETRSKRLSQRPDGLGPIVLIDRKSKTVTKNKLI